MSRNRLVSTALTTVLVASIPVTAFAQAPGDGYQAPPAAAWRSGFTFDAELGLGFVHSSTGGSSSSSNTDLTLSGLDLGVGAFLTPKLALTLRFAGVTFGIDHTSYNLVDGFIGPSLQYWANDHVWLRGGLGIAVIGVVSGDSTGTLASESAFGLDLGVGYTFSQRRSHSLNVSAEVLPGFFDRGTATSVSVLFGYQYL